MNKKEVAIEIAVLIFAIAIGVQIWINAGPQAQTNLMCQACYKQNWTGHITGELSYSCEWLENVNQTTFKSWCYNNSPLFSNRSD